MDRERFRQLAVKAVEELPEELASLVENADIVVEDWPTSAQIVSSRLRKGETLLGLYEGVPLTRRTSHYGLVPPDKITLFQRPIEARFRNDDEVADEIRRVVHHEIAHYFGISDARLRQLEKKKESQ